MSSINWATGHKDYIYGLKKYLKLGKKISIYYIITIPIPLALRIQLLSEVVFSSKPLLQLFPPIILWYIKDIIMYHQRSLFGKTINFTYGDYYNSMDNDDTIKFISES